MSHMHYLLQFAGNNLCLPARGGLPLFTESPGRGVPGNSASGDADSRINMILGN